MKGEIGHMELPSFDYDSVCSDCVPRDCRVKICGLLWTGGVRPVKKWLLALCLLGGWMYIVNMCV